MSIRCCMGGSEILFNAAKVREGFECEIDDLYVAGDGPD